MVKDTTLYDILDINSNASNDEIIKAFRKLAIKYHPDKNLNDETANNKFIEINQAKDILTNPEKRKQYDDLGMDMINKQFQPFNPNQAFNPFQNQPGFNPNQPFNPENLFKHFNGFHPMQKSTERENIIINQSVRLDDIYNNNVIHIPYKQKYICNICNGEGTKNGKNHKCNQCKGKGIVKVLITMGPIVQNLQHPCTNCNGLGKIIYNNDICSECDNGYKLRDVTIAIPLKNGLANGNKIEIANHGNQCKDFKSSVIIIINILPHDKFKRENNDLKIEIDLTLYQALYGFNKVIEHLDKRKLYIQYEGRTEFNETKKIIGEGMDIINTNNKGDLYITFKIKLPLIEDITFKNILSEMNEDESEVILNKNKYIKSILI